MRAGSALVAGIVAAACGSLQQAAADTGSPPTPAGSASIVVQAPRPPEARIVALVVPLSGPQRAVGEAIRDGFIGGRLDAGAATEIRVFDEAAAGPSAAIGAALGAGAEAIVGPLLKESVAAVAPTAPALPMLALNATEPGTPAPPSFHQFPLAPEDEARLAAARAAADGALRAVALVPDTDWGRRMLGAFTPELEARGGAVVAFRYYNPAARDYTALLERMLLIDESRARHRALEQRLGTTLAFEPRARGDADFVFLAGTPTAGRLLKPQLRFVYAGNLPVYATSAIHQPGAPADPDLDGIIFPDAPAVLGNDERTQAFRRTVTEQWPAGGMSRMRFFAMGHDAFALILALSRGDTVAAMDGLSGTLTLDTDGRVRRELVWARFRDGTIVPLPDAITPAATDP